PDPLMGWISSDDTLSQIKLRFDSKEDAIAFAHKRGLPYVVQEPKARKIRPKAYADNFASDRAQPWTH
ncbi:MAG: NADH dehydrogenase ubiquinone Fe-S protein 4, partial [Pseudomonadota bacterium]